MKDETRQRSEQLDRGGAVDSKRGTRAVLGRGRPRLEEGKGELGARRRLSVSRADVYAACMVAAGGSGK
jgi:hypothetical protein